MWFTISFKKATFVKTIFIKRKLKETYGFIFIFKERRSEIIW